MDETNNKAKSNTDRIKNYTLMDDIFMRAVLESNPDLVEFFLRIILDNENLKVEEISFQEDMKNLVGRSTVLDSYGKLSDGSYFDLEFERSDNRASIDRSLYHESLINSKILPPGSDFDLPNRYIIFITENDRHGNGKPVYEAGVFENNGKQLLFDDKLKILFVNGAYQGKDDLGKLVHDLKTANPEDMYFSNIAQAVKYFKLEI